MIVHSSDEFTHSCSSAERGSGGAESAVVSTVTARSVKDRYAGVDPGGNNLLMESEEDGIRGGWTCVIPRHLRARKAHRNSTLTSTSTGRVALT